MNGKNMMPLVFVALLAGCSIWANPIPERVKGLEGERCEFRSVGPGGGGWIQSMLLSRHDRNRFFVGCGDELCTWTYLDGPNLQNWNVQALAADAFVPHRLWMGTCGNSVFVLKPAVGRRPCPATLEAAD